MFEALLLNQTGKSFDDFESVEQALASLSVRLNNERIMANLLGSASDAERRVVQMWRQLVPASRIAANTSSTPAAVEQTIRAFIARLRESHFTKFTKGWTLDDTGAPISPDQPTEVPRQVADTRFQQWLLVLGLRHD